MAELKLFGQPMDHQTYPYHSDTWSMKIGANCYVDIFEHNYDGKWICHTTLESSVAKETPELARDDAAAALRELYDALGEMVEPWTYGGHPDEEIDCEVAYVGREGPPELAFDRWSVSGRCWLVSDELFEDRQVYAWRPMPKAPGRKP